MSTLDSGRLGLVVAAPGQSGEGGEAAATGYFLSGDLVLTVRHAGRPGSVFEVRCESGGSEKDKWSSATVVWQGARDVDALLLRTEKSFGEWDIPEFKPGVSSGVWKSEGYPRAAVDKADRKTQPLSGTFDLSRGQGLSELALVTDRNIQEHRQENWKGLSGAPIFSATDEGGLVGIVTSASLVYANELRGLPIARLLEDISFVSHIYPSFLGALPDRSFCAVLTREGGPTDLGDKVSDVIRAHPETFGGMREDPIEIDTLKSVSSVVNWAVTVKALAQADFVVADVTSFQPAMMLLLGVRSVLRRGVTISVTEDDLPSSQTPLPFNVQETRVISFVDDLEFYEHLHAAMSEGATSLANDPNYLDLPAYQAVRFPRPESWTDTDGRYILLLCPFGGEYQQAFRRKLDSVIRGSTGDRRARRMLDLRSPRLVGPALYEQIRWASRCIVDWSQWRANVFFELGVRLACSENDPLLIIKAADFRGPAHEVNESAALQQYEMLTQLLRPVPYDPDGPRLALKGPLERWMQSILTSPHDIAAAVGETSATEGCLPPSATFRASQDNFRWQLEGALTPPHREQQRQAEWILGTDPVMHPERLILFAANPDFDRELQAAVSEKWIAAWLYLSHLARSEDSSSAEVRDDLELLGPLVQQMLKFSGNKRHQALRREIGTLLRRLETLTEGDDDRG